MCMVRVILKSNEADNLCHHKRNLTKTKRYVLCFLQELYQFGYRHFVIYINDPTDFWLAEMLYFMHYCKKYADVVYSLYFLTEDADSSDFFKWLDDEYFLNDVSLSLIHI